MLAFTSPLPIASAKNLLHRSFKCPQSVPHVSTVRMAASNESEDDDATMGNTGPVYGLQIPNMTAAEKTWLDQAPNNEEFMVRMRKIARRLEDDRQRKMGTKGKTASSDYMNSLKRN